MPSDDFWADLPKEKQKKLKESAAPKSVILPDPIQDKPAAPTPKSASESAAPSARRSIILQLLWITGTAFLMMLCAVAGGTVALWEGTSLAVADEITDPIVIEVPRGRTTRQIASDLEAANVIVSRWPFLFDILTKQKTVRAGIYSISSSATVQEIVTILTDGEVTANRVTIPEGWRIEQIAERFAALGIVTRDEFLTASVYDPVRYTLPPGITRDAGTTLEGLLFPDTYEFRIGVSSKEIVQTMLQNFIEKTQELQPTYEQLVLASIVEREATGDTDRAQIAGVYQNRLDSNLKLDADPTVQYGKDTFTAADLPSGETMDWWEPITLAEYQSVKSPWNTYLVTGLPPTPIANPGLASLEAAVRPADHQYYYFLHRSDGTSIFSKTKDEHDRARAER